jgi:hypothetical protein
MEQTSSGITNACCRIQDECPVLGSPQLLNILSPFPAPNRMNHVFIFQTCFVKTPFTLGMLCCPFPTRCNISVFNVSDLNVTVKIVFLFIVYATCPARLVSLLMALMLSAEGEIYLRYHYALFLLIRFI